MNAKRIDVLVIILLAELAVLYNFFAVGSFFGTAMLGLAAFTVPPVIYMALRHRKPWKKIILATLVFGGLFGFIFEFVQEANLAYTVLSTIFPKFVLFPIDNVIGHMLMALLTFTFYEHFLSESKSKAVSKRLGKVALIAAIVGVLLVIAYLLMPQLITFSYSYAILGLVAITPLFIYIYNHPVDSIRMVAMIPYFFILYLVVEMFAVDNSWWVYQAEYVGNVSLFRLNFPFEELFFWMFFYAATITAYYKIAVEKRSPHSH
ncbi:MAG: hypothetical protein WAO28_01745 [Candidatus Microsaccharimonas sp.]